ncbi:hypothetical protein SS50377_23745 [Spironucleus salmonicida]|uniref:Uncharacterized protein n=1 Tax=Spironucleus salmonicida TaxID=348837 RepID=V6LZY7_9EUKA|nr:hypothetical protein SS50377_23745 [Spironucleus salmonicida]|eukprot:EST46424.1 Hypothetical protein SS50377_13508 [Spironucleus salmonicida]
MGIAPQFTIPNPDPSEMIKNNTIYLNADYLQFSLQNLLDLLAKSISLLRFDPNFKKIQPGKSTKITVICVHPFSGDIIIRYNDAILALVKMYTNGALIALRSCQRKVLMYGQNQADYVDFDFYENFNQFYYFGAKIAEEVGKDGLLGVVVGLVKNKQGQCFIPFHFDTRVLSWEQVFEFFKLLPNIALELGEEYNIICSRYVTQYNYFVLFVYKVQEFFTLLDLVEGNVLEIVNFILDNCENSAQYIIDVPVEFQILPSSLQFLEAFCNDSLIKQNKSYVIKLQETEVNDMRIMKLNLIKFEIDSVDGHKAIKYVDQLIQFFQDQNKLRNVAQKININEIAPPTFDYQHQNVEKSDDLDNFDIPVVEKPKKIAKFKYDMSMTSLDVPINLQTAKKQTISEQLLNILPNEKENFKIQLDKLPNIQIQPKIQQKMDNVAVLIPELDEFLQGILSSLIDNQDAEICFLDAQKYPKIQKFVNLNINPKINSSQVLTNLNAVCNQVIKLTQRNCYCDESRGVLIIGG